MTDGAALRRHGWQRELGLSLSSTLLAGLILYLSGRAQITSQKLPGLFMVPSDLSLWYENSALWSARVLVDLLLISPFPGWDHFHPAVFIDAFGLNHFISDDIFWPVPRPNGFNSKAALFPLPLHTAALLSSQSCQCLGFHQDIHNLSPKVQTSRCVLLMCTERVCAWVHVHMHLPHRTQVLITGISAGDWV